MADRDSYLFFEQEGPNPQSTLESFDAIYYAALQVIIVAGANGVSGLPIYHHTYLRCSVNQYHDFFFLQWSPLMYSMIDAEYFVSCLFFIAAIIVLNFWLINLFVAVITNTFGAIRSETKKSAFGAAP